MNENKLSIDVQTATQNRWTIYQNLTARFRDVAAPTRKILREVIDCKVSRCANQRILDHGFGHGNLLFWFRPPTQVFGIELSKLAIRNAERRAKRYGYPFFRFHMPNESDSVAIEYSDQFFNIVLSSNVLEHVYNDDRQLQEYYRVLKPRGLLFLAVPQDAKHENLMGHPEDRKNPNYPKRTYHVWKYNAETLRYLAMKAGFDIVKLDRFHAIKNKRKRWPRPIQIAHLVTLSVLPYDFTLYFDRRVAHEGFPCAQLLIIAQRPDTIK
jgi:SAM-dependent methyltransferase